MDNGNRMPGPGSGLVEMSAPKPPGRLAGVWSGLVQFLYIVFILLWPFTRMVILIDVTFQFFWMLYHWNTPDMHAGWTFLLHFSVPSALTYIVAFWQPKSMRK